MNSENLFKQALMLIQENDSIRNSEEVWNIARALQILIEANKLESEITPLKIKIIMAMASCNYQIDNLDYAYNCAVIAKEKIDEYIKSNSPFDEISTRKLLREEDCDEIIEAVKRNGVEPSRLMDNFVLNTLCTTNIRKVFPPKNECMFTRDELYHLIHALEQTKNAITSQAYAHGDFQIAEQVQSIFNTYKYPLYYIWQKYLFGRDEEVWAEEESMMPYQIFISNIKEHTDELISMLNNSNPFAPLSNGAAITKLLHKILSDLQTRLHEGRI
ncbi:hypothetical protein [Barnesiella viscericola]|nr:hypothetical protein [Barnesiella viscericola]